MPRDYRHLVILNLILKRLKINIDKNLDELPLVYLHYLTPLFFLMQERINFDSRYFFKFIKTDKFCKLKCPKLEEDLQQLMKRRNKTDYVLFENQYQFSQQSIKILDNFIKILKVPPELNITYGGWIFFLSLYIFLEKSKIYNTIDVFSNYYRDFIPYLNIAHERSMEIYND